MIYLSGNSRIFLFKEPIDMRKGIEKLSLLVESHCQGELISGAYFVFVNQKRDKMKVLYWDSDGFAIWWKRLEKGSFQLLRTDNFLINRKEFFMLLEGITPEKIQNRFRLS